MKRTQEEAEQTRQALLEAAEQVFGRQGFAATRLSDIAEAANVTRGAIYHHFGNKQDLINALQQERFNPYLKIADDALNSDLNPKEKIKNMCTELLHRAHNDVTFLTQERFFFLKDIEFCNDKKMCKEMEKRGHEFVQKIMPVIVEGQKTGDIRSDISPMLAAINIIAYIRGLVVLLITGLGDELFENQTDVLVETLFKGL